MRSFDLRIAMRGNVSVSLVISEYDDEVGFRVGAVRETRAQYQDKYEEREEFWKWHSQPFTKNPCQKQVHEAGKLKSPILLLLWFLY